MRGFFVFISLYNAYESIPVIKPNTGAKEIYSSIASSDEYYGCVVSKFVDESNNNKEYHYSTQGLFNFTSANIYDDELNQYNNKNNGISNQLPFYYIHDYSDVNQCVSPKTNDILTCFSNWSCCGGCSFIGCILLKNNGSNPYYANDGLQIVVTNGVTHALFNRHPIVLCMDDGYVISWITANSGTNGSTTWSNFTIQYSYMDLDGNVNEYYYARILKGNVVNFDIYWEANSFWGITHNNTIIMTFNSYPNNVMYLKSMFVEYTSMNDPLTIRDIYVLAQNNSEIDITSTVIYRPIQYNFNNDCCIIYAYQYEYNLMISIQLFNGDFIIKDKPIQMTSHIGYANIIDISMLTNPYFMVLYNTYDDNGSSINGQMYYITQENNNYYISGIVEEYQFVTMNGYPINYYSTFCSNVLLNDNNIYLEWISQPVNASTNANVYGYIQTWKITES